MESQIDACLIRPVTGLLCSGRIRRNPSRQSDHLIRTLRLFELETAAHLLNKCEEFLDISFSYQSQETQLESIKSNCSTNRESRKGFTWTEAIDKEISCF